ncbi:MAG TPA: IS3 family transposase [Candidatus Nanoarchaeia archaeon]|nr:IS3 family transposase [Candidatus Nanoarchaeia archaeon]
MISAEDKQLILKEYKIVQNSGISKTSFCKIIGLNRRTLQRWESGRIIDNRKGAAKRIRHKLSKEEEDKIINVCCSKRFADLNPYEIVAILAQEGIYIASESSIYRILRKNKLLKNRTGNKKRGSKKPEEIIASRPNELWSWDITYLKTKVRGVFYYLYVFMDIWSRKITAWGIFEEESGEHAKEILHEYCLREGITVNKIHSDNGAPMKSVIFLGLLEFLGVTKSFSRPRTSNDNAYSESLFKTVKYSAGFPGSFETIEKARDWFSNFRKWYNTEHLHSGIMYVTPEQRYNGTDKNINEKGSDLFKCQNKKPVKMDKKL